MVEEFSAQKISHSSDELHLHDGTPVGGQHAVALLYLLHNGHLDPETAVLERRIGDDLCPGSTNRIKAASQLMRGTKRVVNGAIKVVSAAKEQSNASPSSRWELVWFASIPPEHFPYYQPWLPRINDQQIPLPASNPNGAITSSYSMLPPPIQVTKVDMQALSASPSKVENPEAIRLQRLIASATDLEKLRNALVNNRQFFADWDEERLLNLFRQTKAHYQQRPDSEVSYQLLGLLPEFEVVQSGQSHIERLVNDPRFAAYACIFMRQLHTWSEGKSIQRFDVVTDTPTAHELADAIRVTLRFIRSQKKQECSKPPQDQQVIDLWKLIELSGGFILREKTVRQEALRKLQRELPQS